jgi:hypothetical protein
LAEAQALDLFLTCAGLGPALAVSRLSRASRRSQGSLSLHVLGRLVSAILRQALRVKPDLVFQRM